MADYADYWTLDPRSEAYSIAMANGGRYYLPDYGSGASSAPVAPSVTPDQPSQDYLSALSNPNGPVNFGMMTAGFPMPQQEAPQSQRVWSDQDLAGAHDAWTSWAQKYAPGQTASEQTGFTALQGARAANQQTQQNAYNGMQGTGQMGGVINAGYGQSQALQNSPYAALMQSWSSPQAATGPQKPAGNFGMGSNGSWGGPWSNSNPFGSSQ
jgi:hypothetical protein